MWLDAVPGDFDLGQVCVRHDDGLERRARYVLFVESDVDAVIAGLGGQIGNGASAIAVVPAIYSGLAGSLDSHAEATLAGAPRVDYKLGRLVHHAVGETGTGGSHFGRIGAVDAGEPVGLARDRFAAEADAQEVLAELGGREVHQVAFVGRHHVRLDAVPGRSRDRHLEVRRPARFLRYHAELLQAVHRGRCEDVCGFSRGEPRCVRDFLCWRDGTTARVRGNVALTCRLARDKERIYDYLGTDEKKKRNDHDVKSSKN